MSETVHRALGDLPDAKAIAKALNGEFLREMEARGIRPLPDPVLSVLFQTLAVQVSRVYEEAESEFPIRMLDDLVDGLAMEPRLASPAQAVVHFTNVDERETLSPETQLRGFTATGTQRWFAPDEAIDVSPATLAFAAVYEAGRLHAVPGARVPGGASIPPGSAPLVLKDAAPTLWLAFDVDEGHLGGMGLFLDTEGAAAAALARAPWQILDAEGTVGDEAMLRPTPGRGGVRRLAWFRDPPPEAAPEGPASVFSLREGPYGPRVWVFPPVPRKLRHRCAVPRALRAAALLLLPENAQDALERPLAWVQVPLPAGARGVVDALHGVQPHCVTASNVEVAGEQVPFDRVGTAVRLVPEGSRDRHLMGVLSVTGQRGARYVEESAVEGAPGLGRWRYRDGHLELRPARHATGLHDEYAMVRLLYCDGEKANGIGIGDLNQVDPQRANIRLGVTNLTVSRGGLAPPAYAPSRVRFAELLRTRERVVTAADVEAVARAFDPRIARVQVESRAEAAADGVTLIENVTAWIGAGDLTDPDGELPRLSAALQDHLQRRSVLGHVVRAEVRAGGGGER